jgi:adenosine deaminase
MKKPAKRATLLEHVLSDFLKLEDILLQLELKDALQPLTAKEKQLYTVMKQCLRELVRDLTNDVEQERRAA